MEDDTNPISSLFEKAAEYGKTGFELAKLKGVDKASDVISSLVSNSVVFVLVALFLLFFNLGLAFWLGSIMDSASYGFFIVAAFYALLGIIIHLFMHKWFKRKVSNYIIKIAFK